MYQPARDRGGVALVLDEIFEREYEIFRLTPRLEGKAAAFVQRQLADVVQVTLSPGYERWARHLLLLERHHELRLPLPALLAVEVDGLVEVDAARLRQKLKHPACFACGVAQPNRFQMQCVDCGVKYGKRSK